MPTICCQILIFVDKFYWFFYQQLEIEFWKIPVRKIWWKVMLIEILLCKIFYVNVNFPWKKTNTKYELIWTCFSRTLVTDKGANIVQNIFLTEQPFLSKVTSDCLWNVYLLEVCMHLISNFTHKDTILKRIPSSCYRIFLNWS